jgi:hypothetical protein
VGSLSTRHEERRAIGGRAWSHGAAVSLSFFQVHVSQAAVRAWLHAGVFRHVQVEGGEEGSPLMLSSNASMHLCMSHAAAGSTAWGPMQGALVHQYWGSCVEACAGVPPVLASAQPWCSRMHCSAGAALHVVQG